MNGFVFQSYYDIFCNQCFLIIIKILKKKVVCCSRLKHTKIVRKYLGHDEDGYHYFFFNGKGGVDFVFSIFRSQAIIPVMEFAP